jgi:DNA-binding response OmpR family regulator
MLTVRSEINDKVELLESGADDYMTKPFSFEELLARIKTLMKRPAERKADIIKIGDLTIHMDTQQVTRGKKLIYLTRKEFALLEYLLRQNGGVVSRGMIMEHVWDMETDPFSNTVEAHIFNLRKKIELAKKNRIIENVPGREYRINILPV